MSNTTIVTKEMVIRSQSQFGYEHYYVYNMSDINRHVAWDECGFEIGIADTKLQAEALVTMYWWHYLNGSDPRPGQLPHFTATEQLDYIKEHKQCCPSQVVEFKDGQNPNADKPVMLQLSESGYWRQLTNDEVESYNNDVDGPVQRWIAQCEANEQRDDSAMEDVF